VPEAEIVRAAEIVVATVVDAVVVLAVAAVGADADAADALVVVVVAAAGVVVRAAAAVGEAGTRPLATDIHGSHGSNNRDRTRVRSFCFSVKSSS
jgi:hypothetical protein